MTWRSIRLAAVAMVAAAATASGQSVRGTVVERGTGARLSGVVVQLLDSVGGPVSRTITGGDGSYRLTAPDTGGYSLRVLRIGYRPSVPVSVALRPGVDVVQPALYTGANVLLDTVRVAARRECQVRPAVASATFDAWEQIRAALVAAQATADKRLMTSLVAYERALDNRGERVLRQATELRTGVAGVPWQSIPVDSLSSVGYAVTEPTGATTYFAPDLSVLTSDQFLGEHCLRLVVENDRLGIAFEPTRSRRNLPEIEGTMWIDRPSKELRSLDFKYVNVTRHEEELGGGHVEFTRLRDGEWLISTWTIRAPVLETRYGAGGALREGNQIAGRIVREVHEKGGLLALARSGRDTLWTNPALEVAGTVQDSAGRGVAGVSVTLRGTTIAARTNSVGRFALEDVVPGAYMIEAQTDAMASAGQRESQYVSLTGARDDIRLRVPGDSQVVVAECRNLDPRHGMLG
ncbi:MAG: carboxypeptidase-like regulatory domain-containing protein, partial [Gemmatimonadaceae bacterium]